MVEKSFRSKPKSASAERCLRSLSTMKPITASEMELSNRSIVCVTGVLSHCGLRKANCKMGVVTGIRSLPGIAVPLLHWLTRDEDIHRAAQAPYCLLEEAPELSYGDQNTGNMLIQGDNLDALKALLPYYAG